MTKQLTINLPVRQAGNLQFTKEEGFIPIKSGFTLVELLVVIAILGILVSIGLVSFISAQARGRDTQRKSDLKQIGSALELYYSDYGSYPSASGGQIAGCPSVTSTVCTWGSGQFTDQKTIYFRVLPKDPVTGQNYYYRTVAVNSVPNQGFQLFAKLENTQDPECLGENCGTHSDLPSGVSCSASGTCNYAITSPNVTPQE